MNGGMLPENCDPGFWAGASQSVRSTIGMEQS
jgi:hypothetical protein